ncbi:MAG: hypothetical protein K8823_321 [Cenarchaeum symbiont of Oopsacas minuta]|nr:hypothetical protein [Cenarchaeum symbiont of Oopsacas minuta]
MQELALLLTGLVGAASAVAFTKFPRDTSKLKLIGANPRIQREIAYMSVERDILVKTVSRLYQQNTVRDEKRGRLLAKYQNQLGLVLARIEKLEIASKHPDMGPIGDGLVTLMDQKLSTLDKKLHEISSKISIAPTYSEARNKKIAQNLHKDPRIQVSKTVDVTPSEIPQSENNRQRVEITTLTSLAKRSQMYPPSKPDLVEPTISQVASKDPYSPVLDAKPEIIQTSDIVPPKTNYVSDPIKTESTKQDVLTKPSTDTKNFVPKVDADLDNTADLDKLKKDIMKTLEKLDQVEVE